MPINFLFIMGLLLIAAGICYTVFYRFGRISKKFKGQYILQIVSLLFIGLGIIGSVIGLIQMIN